MVWKWQWIARRTYPTSPELGEVGEEKSLYLRELQREHTQGSQGWVEASKQRAHSEERPPPQGALLSPIWSSDTQWNHTARGRELLQQRWTELSRSEDLGPMVDWGTWTSVDSGICGKWDWSWWSLGRRGRIFKLWCNKFLPGLFHPFLPHHSPLTYS